MSIATRNGAASVYISFISRFLAAIIVVLCGVTTSVAADIPQEAPNAEAVNERIESAWEISISPIYGWVPGMNGSVAVFGQPKVDIDVTPIDILQNLDQFLDVLEGAYFGAGQVRHGDFGIAWDLVYIDVFSTDQIGGDFVSGTLDVGFTLTMATLLGTYRLHETPTSHIDAVVGARISDINLNVGVTLGPGCLVCAKDGDTWVDPVIGVKGRRSLSERVYIDGWAMIGGFGVSSDLLWDAYGAIGYEFKDWISAYAGFRGTGMDYQNGAFLWDVTMYGPVIGFELNF